MDPIAQCVEAGRDFVSPGEVVHALRGVNLVVEQGEFVCLHGPSGCGKTTLINLLAGLDVPTSGFVTVLGRRLDSLTDPERTDLRLRQIGVVFQDNNLIPEFTAIENVMLPLQSCRVTRSDACRQGEEALARVGLVGDVVNRRPAHLSGGQRQRVGIARALVGQRQLLLADEPTGALDSANSLGLFDLIGGLCADGLTAVVASHDPRGRAAASRAVELTDGCVVT